jgi:hypothetical protein
VADKRAEFTTEYWCTQCACTQVLCLVSVDLVQGSPAYKCVVAQCGVCLHHNYLPLNFEIMVGKVFDCE